MVKSEAEKAFSKEYNLRDGNLTTDKNKKFMGILFIECKDDKFFFLDKEVKVHSIDPHTIKDFVYSKNDGKVPAEDDGPYVKVISGD